MLYLILANIATQFLSVFTLFIQLSLSVHSLTGDWEEFLKVLAAQVCFFFALLQVRPENRSRKQPFVTSQTPPPLLVLPGSRFVFVSNKDATKLQF